MTGIERFRSLESPSGNDQRECYTEIEANEGSHISPESRWLSPRIDGLHLLTLELGGLRLGGRPSSSSTGLILVRRAWGGGGMSLGRDLGLSLITHKNATLAESRPVSLAGSTTKKMLFPNTVIRSHYICLDLEKLELLMKSKLY